MLLSTLFSTLFVFMSFLSHAQKAAVEVKVQLSPAGNFIARTEKVIGEAQLDAATGTVKAQNIKVGVQSLETGIELRNKHTVEKLQAIKFPAVELIKAIGKDGKGKAQINIMGKKLNVEGTYEIVGSMLKAQFPISLSDLDIGGIRYMGVGVKDTVNVEITVPVRGGVQPRGLASE